MLKSAYLLAKIGADTAENELHFSDIFEKNRDVTTGGRASRFSGPARLEILKNAR